MRLLLIVISAAAVGSCSPSSVLRDDFKMDRVERVTDKTSRPARCAHLRRTYTDDNWDPVTETYPENKEWNMTRFLLVGSALVLLAAGSAGVVCER